MKNFLLKLLKPFNLFLMVLCFITFVFSTSNLMAQDCNQPINSYPWNDNFEIGLSDCYTQMVLSGNTEWILHEGGYHTQSGFFGYPENAHSGVSNLWFFSETVGSSTRIYTQQFDFEGGTNATLTFWHAQVPWSGSQDILKVYYKNSITSNWILLKTYAEAIEDWTEQTIVLPELSSTYWIAFEGISNYGRGIVIDDITVTCNGCMTECSMPRNVSRVMHSPNYFDVKLTWNAPDTTGYNTQIVGYNIYKNGRNLITPEPITDLFYQLNDLEPTGGYSYGVTVVYSDGCESEKAPINFTLLTPPTIEMPITGTITYTTCNGIIYDNGGVSSDYSNNCNGIIIVQPNQSGYTSTIQGTYNTEAGNDKLYIFEGIGTNGTLLATYSGTNGVIPATSSTLGALTIQFTSNTSVVNSGFIIHVSCIEIEDCLPPLGLTANVISSSEINLSWTPHGEDDVSWILEYGISGFTPGTNAGTLISSLQTPSYTITNANASTNYDVYVQTICSDGDTSIRSAAYSFTTPCGVFALPYIESFDNELFPPNCWTNVHTAGPGALLWQRNTSATYVHSGAGSARLPDQQTGNRTDLVTGQLNIPAANAYQITFWMFRSDSYNTKTEEGVKVWVNTTPDTIGGTSLLHIRRSYQQEPQVPAAGWYEYNATIPSEGLMYVIFQGISEFGAASYIDDIMVAEIPTCLRPSNLTATLPTENSITLSWTAGGDETLWNLEYGLAGFQQGTGTLIENITNPYTLTGLSASTEYSVYVQAKCADGSTSYWTNACNFATTCGVMTLPLIEGFETSLFPPNCWTNVHTAGSGTALWQRNTSSSYIHSGTGSAKLPDQQTGNRTDLVTSQLNIPAASAYEIVFWMYRSDSYTSKTQEGVKVWVNTTPDTINGTALLHIRRSYQQEPQVPTAGWYEYNATIPSEGLMYVIFQGISEYGTASYIDDISVRALPPCPKPTSVTASNLTSSSVELSWTTTPAQTSWNIEYGPSGFQQGSGTLVNAITENPYTLTGLTPSTAYSVYVQANCPDNEISLWSDVCSFVTPCVASTPPYTESFDNELFPPTCWTSVHTAGSDDALWERNTTATYIHSGAGSAKLPDQTTGNRTDLITGLLNIPAANAYEVTFWMYRSNSSNTKTQEGVKVWVNTTPDTIGGTALLHIRRSYQQEPQVPAAGWYKYNATIPNEGLMYVIFQGISEFGTASYIDDVEILQLPSCPHPSALTLSTIASQSAVIAWTENGSATTWEVEYGISGFVLGTGTRLSNITENPYQITELTPLTNYDCYVRSICGEEDISEWSSAFSFTTICSEYNIPFMEDFTNTTYPPNTCWEKLTGLASSAFSGNNPTSTFSGWTRITTNAGIEGAHPRLNIYGTTCKYWLVTPTIDLGSSSNNVLMFDLAFTDYNNGDIPEQVGDDDKFMVIISTDGGITWSSSNATIWDNVGTNYVLSQIPNVAQTITIPLSAYSGMIKIAFYGESTVSNSDNDLHIGNIYVGSSDICTRPTNFAFSNPDISSVELTWQSGGTETSWDIEYGFSGYIPGTGTLTSVSSTNAYTLTGLASNTTYDVYIRAICSEGNVSAWRGPLTFNTACGTVSIPFVENFDRYGTGSSAQPLCWTIGGTSSSLPYCYATYSHSSPASLRIYSTSNTHVYAATPPLDVEFVNTLQVNLWGYASSTSNTIEIGVMTDPTNIETFVPINNISVTNTSTWENFTVMLNTYEGNGKYIAFKGGRDASNTFYIDDVLIDLIPSCPPPTDFLVTNISDFDATLGWTESGSATTWNLEYGISGFTQGSGTVVSVTTTSHTLTDITPLVNYDVYVQANCGEGDLSTWTGPISFICGQTEYNMPVSGTTTITTCSATVYDDGGPNGNYSNSSDGIMIIEPSLTGAFVQVQGAYAIETNYDLLSIYDGSGTGGELLGSYSNSDGGTIPLTTSLSGPLTLHFTSDAGVRRYGFELQVSCEGGGDCPRPRTFVASTIFPRNIILDWIANGSENMWEIEYGASGFAHGTGTTINVTTAPHEITGLSPETSYDFYIRAICSPETVSDWKSLLNVTTAISCPSPSYLGLSAISPTSATLTWTENGDASSWRVEYGLNNFVLGTGTQVTANTNPFTIEGLTEGVQYQYYVQAICGEGDVSSWVGPKNFTPGTGLNECIVVGEGTTGTYQLPMNTYYNYSYTQQIITSDELMDLGMFPGSVINSIAFQYICATAQTKSPVIIYLGEIERTAFASPSDWEPVNNMEQVFNGSITFDNTGEDYWVDIPLNDPYFWNGGNLVIAVVNNHGSYPTGSSPTFYEHTATNNISIQYSTDSQGPINPSSFYGQGSRSSDRNNIRLCITSSGGSICRMPKDFETTNITTTGVTLDWEPRDSETQWQIEYGPTGFLQGTGTMINTYIHPQTINGLTPFTTYDFYLRAVCEEGNYSTWKALHNITTLENCVRPSDFILTEITETTATLSWVENGTSTVWYLEYGPQGFELGTGIPYYNVPNPCTIIGLENGVSYDCYIRSVCSETNTSVWVGPRNFVAGSINCAVIGEEEIESYVLPINTYYRYSYSQQIFTAQEMSAMGVGASEINALSFQYFYEVSQIKDPITIYLGNTTKTTFSGGDWEPVANLQQVFTGAVEFSNTNEDFWVEIPFSESFSWNGSDNILVAVLNNHGSYPTGSSKTFYTHATSDNKSLRYQVDGSTPINPGTITSSGTAASSRSNIKFCFVQSEQTSCVQPTNLTASNTTINSAVVSWTSGGTESSWNIQVGEKGFVPTTTATHHNVGHPYTITGLAQNTEYAFYVQSNCNNGEISGWAGPCFFSTACDMVLEVPFVESFESGEKPLCWQNQQLVGNRSWSYQAGVIETTPQTAFDGNYNALLYSPGDYSITRLVTPIINLSSVTQTPILAFAYAQSHWGYGQDKLSIWIKNSQGGNWSKIAEYSESTNAWIEESIVLPNPSASYWIAFEVEGNWGHGVGLDKVTVLQTQVAPIVGNSTVCAQSTETYSTTAGMTNYIWNVIGGEITSGQGTNTITVLWGDNGNGRVDVKYGELSYNNNLSIQISESPMAAVFASEYEICAGNSTTLTVVGEGNYLWSTGATTASIVVYPNQTTTYSVSVYDNEQCATELEIEIVVNTMTGLQILGDNAICYGESTILRAVGGKTYLWSTGETTSAIEVSPSVNTFYSVLATDMIGCTNTDSIMVLVTHVLPPTNLNADPTGGFISVVWEAVSGAVKYYIYRNGILYDSTALTHFEDQDIMLNTEYCYTVSATRNSCESSLSNSDCALISGIEESENNIRLYPNPANTNITIEGDRLDKVEVFNILGQQVTSSSLEGKNWTKINTTHLESGVYIVHISTTDGRIFAKRIIITH